MTQKYQLSGLLTFFSIFSMALLFITNSVMSKFLNSDRSDFYLRRVWVTVVVIFIGVPIVIIVKNGVIRKRIGQAFRESNVGQKSLALVRKLKTGNASVAPVEAQDVEK